MRFRYDFMRAFVDAARGPRRVRREPDEGPGRAAIIGAMVTRRNLLTRSLLGPALGLGLKLAPGPAAWAQQRRSLADPLRLGVDLALFDSGLAHALQRAFGRDTGLAAQLVRGAALPLLEALDRGELDAALTNAPEAEARLDQQGLAHDRRAIARGAFVIVGPAPRGKQPDPAALAGGRQAVPALTRLRDAALAAPGTITFLSAADGSGTHVLEQALWRQARIAPAPPWYAAAGAAPGLIAQARQRGAYALVELGAWLAHGGAPLAVLVEGDPQLDESVHVMRAFRFNHPAGAIFDAWIGGPKGRRVVAGQRGYRVAGA
jgi:tungstate transport system substrate-binding protein